VKLRDSGTGSIPVTSWSITLVDTLEMKGRDEGGDR